MCNVHDKEALREINERRDLILKTQSARLKDRTRYMEILKKYEGKDGLLYRMPIDKLREFTKELE